MGIRVSIQVAADAPDASVGHLASGALVRPDLVVVPNVDASVLRHEGPYVAVIVTQVEGAPWEVPTRRVPGERGDTGLRGERFGSDGMAGLGIVAVEWVRCAPEEVHTVDPLRLQAGFRLAACSTGPVAPVDIDTLLNTLQPDVWPEALTVLAAIPTALPNGLPRLGATAKVAWHGDTGFDRGSWCRFVPWC